METDRPYLFIEEVCAFTGLSKSTIYKEIRRGTFPPSINIVRGRIAWTKTALKKWLQEKGEEK